MKSIERPWEVHGKVDGLDVDRKCLTGQILGNFSQSCKRCELHWHNVRYKLTRVAGERCNVRLSTARHAYLQPGLGEIPASYLGLGWSSCRRCRRRLLWKGSTLPESLFPRGLLSSLPLVSLDLGFDLCPCLCIVEFFCIPSLPNRARYSGEASTTLPCFLFSISFTLSFVFRSSRNFPISSRDQRISESTDGSYGRLADHLCRFPPDLFISLSLFRFLGGLLRPLLRHASFQLRESLLLFFLRERFDLQRSSKYSMVSDGRSEAYLLCRFFELVVAALLRMEVGKGGVPKHLPALAALDTLPRSETSAQNNTRRGGEGRAESVRTFASTGSDPPAPRSSSSCIGSPSPAVEGSGIGFPSFSLR